MKIINRQKLKQMMDRDEFQVVIEVTDPDAYESFHLPNAVYVPFDENFAHRIQAAAPDKSLPVAAYDIDAQSNGSLKAVLKMEELGYQQVYYYETGKMDWKNSGMPIQTFARIYPWKALDHPL